MSLEESKQMSQGILDTFVDFHAREVPNEIFAETESFGYGSTAMNQSESFPNFFGHPNNYNALIDSVIGEIGIDYDHFDIFKYIDPALDPLRDDGMACLINKIHSDLVAYESNLNTSVGTATKSCCMVPAEDNQKENEIDSRIMWAGPDPDNFIPANLQPLNTLQSQGQIEQQKTKNSQLEEEISHLKQVNLQLQDELNHFKATRSKPQQSQEILQMEQQKHLQVEQASTVAKPIHEIDAQGGIATVNNFPPSSSGLSRKRRRGKLQRYSNESMQQQHAEINEENIVSQSKRIRMIASGAQEQHQVVKPLLKRPARRNLGHITKQTRRCSPRICSQVSVHQKNENINDVIKDDCHNEEDKQLDSDEDDIGANLEPKSKKRNYRGNGLSKKDTTMEEVRVKNDNRYVCDVKNCNSSFASASGVNSHKLMHAGLKPYSCNECNRSFRRKSDLSRHMMTHTGEMPHLCTVCNKSFRQKIHLFEHLNIHTGEKPHLCKVCKISFRRKTTLSDHLKIHTGEKPHLCKVCNKSFRQKIHLSDHLKIHTGTKPHLCNVCNTSFRHKGTLSDHLKIHTGEKPHLCNVCNTSFRLKRTLWRHSKTCAGKKQMEQQLVSCHYCGKDFSDKSSLKSHCLQCYKNHHV